MGLIAPIKYWDLFPFILVHMCVHQTCAYNPVSVCVCVCVCVCLRTYARACVRACARSRCQYIKSPGKYTMCTERRWPNTRQAVALLLSPMAHCTLVSYVDTTKTSMDHPVDKIDIKSARHFRRSGSLHRFCALVSSSFRAFHILMRSASVRMIIKETGHSNIICETVL